MAREAATEENACGDGDGEPQAKNGRRRSLIDFSDEIKVVQELAAEAEKKVHAKEQVCAFVGPWGLRNEVASFAHAHDTHVRRPCPHKSPAHYRRGRLRGCCRRHNHDPHPHPTAFTRIGPDASGSAAIVG